MARSIVSRVAARMGWLDPLSGALQRLSGRLLTKDGAPTPAKDLLNGVWLGHPLHPALTDVPIGAWTATAFFDGLALVSGSDGMKEAADLSLAFGIAGATAAAAAGIADWSDTEGQTRRIGTLHALLNTTGLALNLYSLLKRRTGSRGSGVLLSGAAYAVLNVSAYLGGDLVFARGMGVNHEIWPEPPGEFTALEPALREADLQVGKPVRARAGEVPVCLLRQDGRIVAFEEWCTHLGGPLSEGSVDVAEGTIACPWHGSRFALADGSVEGGPATMPVRTFETRVRDGQIEVKAEAQ